MHSTLSPLDCNTLISLRSTKLRFCCFSFSLIPFYIDSTILEDLVLRLLLELIQISGNTILKTLINCLEIGIVTTIGFNIYFFLKIKHFIKSTKIYKRIITHIFKIRRKFLMLLL